MFLLINNINTHASLLCSEINIKAADSVAVAHPAPDKAVEEPTADGHQKLHTGDKLNLLHHRTNQATNENLSVMCTAAVESLQENAAESDNDMIGKSKRRRATTSQHGTDQATEDIPTVACAVRLDNLQENAADSDNEVIGKSKRRRVTKLQFFCIV